MTRTKIDARALLSVYDKTGLVEFARGLHELGVELVSSGGTAHGDRRRRHPGHRGRRRHRRRPRCSTTGWSRCTRRSTAASSPTAARSRTSPTSRQHGIAAVRPRRVEPLPVPRVARHRDHRHRRPGDDARRGEEPRVGHDRHRAPRSTTPCSTSCARTTARVGDDTRRALALEAFARTAAYDAAIVAWLQARRRAARSTSCSRSNAPTRRCATARTRTSRRRATAPPARTSWWDDVAQHGGLALSYLNSTTPTPRGASCTTSATEPGVRDHQAREPVRRRGRRRPRRPRTSARSSATSGPRSAASSRCNRPIDAATVERMVAGPQADVVIAPGYDDGHDRGADRRSARTRASSRRRRPSRRASTSARSRAGSSCRTPHHFAAARDDWRVVTKRRADRRRSGATPSSRGASAGT